MPFISPLAETTCLLRLEKSFYRCFSCTPGHPVMAGAGYRATRTASYWGCKCLSHCLLQETKRKNKQKTNDCIYCRSVLFSLMEPCSKQNCRFRKKKNRITWLYRSPNVLHQSWWGGLLYAITNARKPEKTKSSWNTFLILVCLSHSNTIRRRLKGRAFAFTCVMLDQIISSSKASIMKLLSAGVQVVSEAVSSLSLINWSLVSRVYLCISSFELPLSSFSDKKTDNFFSDGEGRTAGDESIASTWQHW